MTKSLSLLLVSLFVVWSCDEQSGDEAAPGSSGADSVSTTGGAGTGVAGSAARAGSTSSGGSILVIPGPDASNGADAGNGGQSCSADFAKTELQTVYLAFAFDMSGSMGELDFPYHDPALKWQPVVQATKAFFADASSAGIQASLTFFPQKEEDERCEPATYLSPNVPMTKLPSDVFATAIDDITPKTADEWGDGTPTRAVLDGTYDFLRGVRQDDPSAQYAVVLVTDGYPAGCGASDDDIETVAGSVAASADDFRTYVVGVRNPPGGPDTVSNLNRLAADGGTDQAFLITTGTPEDTTRDLAAAIDSIRQQAVSCQASIPKNPGGSPFDPERVNVTFTSNGEETRLAYDESCQGDDTWRFDDAAAPHAIVLCDATCQEVQRDLTAELNVEFGCERATVPR